MHLIDLVLVMTVNPGFGGQAFLAETVAKIRALREVIDERRLPCHIEVDGGIDPETIVQVARAGANAFVAGAAIFKSSNYARTMKAMRTAARSAIT
jgi:ribulose-phosphate 3-epimerase